MSELFVRSVLFFVASMCMYGMTVYHVKWLQVIDAREYKKEKLKEQRELEKWVL
jgi:hypothetical protein